MDDIVDLNYTIVDYIYEQDYDKLFLSKLNWTVVFSWQDSKHLRPGFDIPQHTHDINYTQTPWHENVF